MAKRRGIELRTFRVPVHVISGIRASSMSDARMSGRTLIKTRVPRFHDLGISVSRTESRDIYISPPLVRSGSELLTNYILGCYFGIELRAFNRDAATALGKQFVKKAGLYFGGRGFVGSPLRASNRRNTKILKVSDELRMALYLSELSLEQIASVVGVGRTQLTRFLRGNARMSLEDADTIAAYLGLQLV